MQANPLTAFCLLLLAACGGDPRPGDAGLPDAGVLHAPVADLSRGASLALACSGCHAQDGAAIPEIDALARDEMLDALRRYRQETDGVTVMHAMMRAYSDADIDALSAYLSERALP